MKQMARQKASQRDNAVFFRTPPPPICSVAHEVYVHSGSTGRKEKKVSDTDIGLYHFDVSVRAHAYRTHMWVCTKADRMTVTEEASVAVLWRLLALQR